MKRRYPTKNMHAISSVNPKILYVYSTVTPICSSPGRMTSGSRSYSCRMSRILQAGRQAGRQGVSILKSAKKKLEKKHSVGTVRGVDHL